MLAPDLAAFVADVARTLADLSGRPPGDLQADVSRDAANLVAALLAADGRLTDDELRAYAAQVGPLLEPPLIVTPAQLRESHVLDGADRWLAEASALFTLLVAADARDGTRHSHVYYERALRLAHRVAALDLVPSATELEAIDRLRSLMLAAMDAAGVARPGQASPATPPAPTPTGATPARDTPPGATPPSSTRPTATPQATSAAGTAATPPATPALPPARPLEDLLAELDALVGLAHVKEEVRRLTSLLQVQALRAERGLPTLEVSRHLVFTGNPGTGKTTVARLLSQLYRTVGVVSVGHLVETDRADLVAGYVGQTAAKTQQVLESALGGMLLIDEAYALARGGDSDFGKESIDTLVKFMEDHRDDLAIVAAGYPEEMQLLLDANPGLRSRFTRTIAFPDYTDDELVSIFVRLCDKNHYALSDGALDQVRHLVAIEPRTRGFGNARFVRNLFEAAVSHQAVRVAPFADPTDEQLTMFTADDIRPVDSPA